VIHSFDKIEAWQKTTINYPQVIHSLSPGCW
jgi:hypothetical protein